MRTALQAALALLSLLPVTAAAQEQPGRYRACLAEAVRAPEATYETALAWRDEGGGLGARHCAAVALKEAGLHEEAAIQLERLAEDMAQAGRPGAAQVLGQAGNAWMLAGRPVRAAEVFESALQLDAADPDILTDRARLFAAEGDYRAAERWLTYALDSDPGHLPARVFRATARRHLGRLAEARGDLERVLRLAPGHVPALLERGIMSASAGRADAARADWLRVLESAPRSTAAELARGHLAKLDLKVE